MRNGSSVRVVSRTLAAHFDLRVHGCVKNGLCMGQDLFWTGSKKSIAMFRCVS